MKRFQSLLILIFAFLTIPRMIYAEDQIPSKKIDLTIDDVSINYYSDNNPFKTQLPEKKIEEVENTNQTDAYGFNPIPQQNIDPDPVVEPVKPTPPEFILNGIVWNTDRPQAIINNQIVNQGDTIEGAKIVSIRKSGIDLIFEDINITLKP